MKFRIRLNDCSGHMIMPFQDHFFCSNETGSVRERWGTFFFVKNGDVREQFYEYLHTISIKVDFYIKQSY